MAKKEKDCLSAIQNDYQWVVETTAGERAVDATTRPR